MRKIPFAGIELTSQRVRGLRGTSELPGRPAYGTTKIQKKIKHKKNCSFPRQLFLYFLFCMCPASLKIENEAHFGHINLKMMPILGTSGPQRQVLYSASKGVNSSSVGLCFFVATGHVQK